jgi:hypothetical protein
MERLFREPASLVVRSLLVAKLSKEHASLTDVSLPLLTGQAGHHPTQTPILTLAM